MLGDINESAAQSVVAEIKRAGGCVEHPPTVEFLSSNWSASEAIGLRCNVTSWEDQVNLFQTAFVTFGSVDVVVRWVFVDCARMTMRYLQVVNAGVNEIGDYFTPKVRNGKPEKPTVTTVDVNLLGSLYSKGDPVNHMFDAALSVSTQLRTWQSIFWSLNESQMIH